MNKTTLLIFSCILALTVSGCSKDDPKDDPYTSEDEVLAGETVEVGENTHYTKLFVLNEGSLSQNNASLDFLRFSNGMYVTKSFSQMNPTLSAGLGDVGNDIQVDDNEAWIAVNNSGLVEVIDARNEKHIASIDIPTPRFIAITDEYVYVTSYSGAYYGGPAKQGAVYRISRDTKQVKDMVNVGYQPEGIVVSDGRIYVANSGGMNAPDYENTISVIDENTFKLLGTISLPTHLNLKYIVEDEYDNLWVSSCGDYFSVHSGLARITPPSNKDSFDADSYTILELPVIQPATNLWCDSKSDYIMTIGNEDEWNWDPKAKKKYVMYSIDLRTLTTTYTEFSGTDFDNVKWAYSLAVDEYSGKIFIGDANDGRTPGFVWCFNSDGRLEWKVNAGIFPGHFAFWEIDD